MKPHIRWNGAAWVCRRRITEGQGYGNTPKMAYMAFLRLDRQPVRVIHPPDDEPMTTPLLLQSAVEWWDKFDCRFRYRAKA